MHDNVESLRHYRTSSQLCFRSVLPQFSDCKQEEAGFRLGPPPKRPTETGLRGYTQNKVNHLVRFCCFGVLRLAGWRPELDLDICPRLLRGSGGPDSRSPAAKHPCDDLACRLQRRPGAGCQHSGVFGERGMCRNSLLGAQLTFECRFERQAGVALVPDHGLDVQIRQSLTDFIQATARQSYVLGVILGTGNNPRLVVSRKPHGLQLVKLGILERRQPD